MVVMLDGLNLKWLEIAFEKFESVNFKYCFVRKVFIFKFDKIDKKTFSLASFCDKNI